eukprot:COSAG01_NODE_811_length_13417_cov_6.641012_8_plen_1526_part_00
MATALVVLLDAPQPSPPPQICAATPAVNGTAVCTACLACCTASMGADRAACEECLSASCGPGTSKSDDDGEGVVSIHESWLVALVLIPFAGRFLFDFFFGKARELMGCAHGPEYKTCIDRPFVQKEIGWAYQYEKPLITIFEEEARRPAHFDYGKAWQKYGGTEFEKLLNIDSISYRRDKHEAQAMLERILSKSTSGKASARSRPPNLTPENVSRFTSAEMRLAWERASVSIKKSEVLVAHFTSRASAELILAEGSHGFRASNVGQGGGGFSVVHADDSVGGPMGALDWAQWQGGAFRPTTGAQLWGEKAADVQVGGKDEDKLEIVFFIRIPKIWLDASMAVEGRPLIRILPLADLGMPELGGFCHLRLELVVKTYVLQDERGAAALKHASSAAAQRWDFFLSHGQAMAGDQVKALCLLLEQRGKTVWYDYQMSDRSTQAMEDGVKNSDNFLLFLSGDPVLLHGTDARPVAAHGGGCCARLRACLRGVLCVCCARAEAGQPSDGGDGPEMHVSDSQPKVPLGQAGQPLREPSQSPSSPSGDDGVATGSVMIDVDPVKPPVMPHPSEPQPELEHEPELSDGIDEAETRPLPAARQRFELSVELAHERPAADGAQLAPPPHEQQTESFAPPRQVTVEAADLAGLGAALCAELGLPPMSRGTQFALEDPDFVGDWLWPDQLSGVPRAGGRLRAWRGRATSARGGTEGEGAVGVRTMWRRVPEGWWALHTTVMADDGAVYWPYDNNSEYRYSRGMLGEGEIRVGQTVQLRLSWTGDGRSPWLPWQWGEVSGFDEEDRPLARPLAGTRRPRRGAWASTQLVDETAEWEWSEEASREPVPWEAWGLGVRTNHDEVAASPPVRVGQEAWLRLHDGFDRWLPWQRREVTGVDALGRPLARPLAGTPRPRRGALASTQRRDETAEREWSEEASREPVPWETCDVSEAPFRAGQMVWARGVGGEPGWEHREVEAVEADGRVRTGWNEHGVAVALPVTVGSTVWVRDCDVSRPTFLHSCWADDCWHQGTVAGVDAQGRPLVRPEAGRPSGRREIWSEEASRTPVPWLRCDPSEAPRGFTAFELYRNGSSWDYARRRNGQTACGAWMLGATRLLLWHLVQPAMYFLVLGVYAGEIDALQLGLGVAVAVREAGYLLTTLACAWANPAFLLVDVGASVRDWRGEFNECGYIFLLMYVLAPEKFVGFSLFEQGGLDTLDDEKLSNPQTAVVLTVLYGGTSPLLDLCGVGALFAGLGSGQLPFALGVGYGVTAAGGTLLAGGGMVMAVVGAVEEFKESRNNMDTQQLFVVLLMTIAALCLGAWFLATAIGVPMALNRGADHATVWLAAVSGPLMLPLLVAALLPTEEDSDLEILLPLWTGLDALWGLALASVGLAMRAHNVRGAAALLAVGALMLLVTLLRCAPHPFLPTTVRAPVPVPVAPPPAVLTLITVGCCYRGRSAVASAAAAATRASCRTRSCLLIVTAVMQSLLRCLKGGYRNRMTAERRITTAIAPANTPGTPPSHRAATGGTERCSRSRLRS